MTEEERLNPRARLSNGDSKGQTYEEVAVSAEKSIRNLVGIPVSLREFLEEAIGSLEGRIAQLQGEFTEDVDSRERELRRTLADSERLHEQEKESYRELIERVEVDLRRQFEQIREQVDQREIASKEAVTKAEQAATTAISAAVATTQTAVTKAETAASNAIIQAAEATKSAVDGVKEGFEQKIATLRDSFAVYTSQHKEVHDSEHIAADKFEDASAEASRQVAEFQRSSERTAENLVKRDNLEEVRRGIEQSMSQRFDAVATAQERSETTVNNRFTALESRSQNTVGRETASNQYFGYIFVVISALVGISGIVIAVVSLATR